MISDNKIIDYDIFKSNISNYRYQNVRYILKMKSK